MYWTLKSVQASQICVWIKINIYFGNSDKKKIVPHNLVFFSFCICGGFAVSGWELGSDCLKMFKAFYLLFYFVFYLFPRNGTKLLYTVTSGSLSSFPHPRFLALIALWHSSQRDLVCFTSCPCVQPAKSSCLWGRDLRFAGTQTLLASLHGSMQLSASAALDLPPRQQPCEIRKYACYFTCKGGTEVLGD